MGYTLKKLLTELLEESKIEKTTLPNTRETWQRIANKDSFDELGLEGSELADFLSEWCAENDYQSI